MKSHSVSDKRAISSGSLWRAAAHRSWLFAAVLALAACTGGGGGGSKPSSHAPSLGFGLSQQEETLGEGAGSLTLVVALSRPASTELELSFAVAGSALEGEDYALPAQPLRIAAGSLSLEFEVQILDDERNELPEFVSWTLEAIDGVELAERASFTLNIEDDDPQPALGFALAHMQALEGAGSVSVELTLSAPSGREVGFGLEFSGDALASLDFVEPPGPLAIAAGESRFVLDLELIQDAQREGLESLLVRLVSLDGASLDPDRSELLIDLLDDDGPNSGPTVPALIAQPSELQLAVRRVGSATPSAGVLVTNPGPGELTFRRVRRTGPAAPAVPIVPAAPLPLLLASGASTQFDVQLTALEPGPQWAELELLQIPAAFPLTRVLVEGGAFGATGAEYLLNASSEVYVDGAGERWIADWSRTGSSSLFTGAGPIGGTLEDGLYRSARVGADFGYRLEIPPGRYRLRLHFAELSASAAGQRVFDLSVEGVPRLDDLDLYASVGPASAHVEELELDVLDGALDLELHAEVGEAILSAVELRSLPVLQLAPTLLDFGVLEQGQFAQLDLQLHNSGLHVAHLERVLFDLDAGGVGSGRDYSIEIDGTRYHGADTTVEHAIDLSLAPGASLNLPVFFEPSQHLQSEFALRLEGPSVASAVELRGLGGAGAGWGYLHPIAMVDPELVVDYDGDQSERVRLSASASHTHETGHSLSAYEWRLSGNLISSEEEFELDLPVGPAQLELTILDDHQPALGASLPLALDVHSREAVPGVLTHYFDAQGGNPADWLANPPAQPDFTQRNQSLTVRSSAGTIGGSPYSSSVLVRMGGDFEVALAADYEFQVQGGADSRFELDGQLLNGAGVLALPLAPGSHHMDARFAVDTIGQLPLVVQVRIAGQTAPDFADGLRYDATQVLPVIHLMDSQGSSAGGELVSIIGFGFHPEAQVEVEWGQLDLGAGSPLMLEQVSDGIVQLITPPGDAAIPGGASTGVISVRVQTPAGTSHSFSFEYLPSGPVAVHFDLRPDLDVMLPHPTALAWGPDGRLWVGSTSGELWALSFDENLVATAVVAYPGVSALTNHEILGLAFDPWQAGGPLRVTVSHSQLYEYGGGPPSGPSEYTGQVSLLSSPNFDAPQPLITRLPVSNHDHGVNALVYDNNGDLLIAVGGCTNAGVPAAGMGLYPDSPLSGAILKARTSRPGFQGALSYRNTADDLENNDQRFGATVYLAPGSDVDVQAPGLRNPFDLCLASWGYLYATDNGPNSGYGFASTGPNSDTGAHASTQQDDLNLIERGVWYGYANRNRGRSDARQNVFRGELEASDAGGYRAPIDLPASSSNGVVEYRSDTFGGAMRGDLLSQKYLSRIRRHVLSADRRRVQQSLNTLPVMPGLNLETAPGGAIVATHYLGNGLRFMTPADPSAIGPTVYDITPWRAPASGGQSFVIGGEHLGSPGATSVEIGGLPAVLTSVSARRIRGIVPVQSNPTQAPVDVVVTVGGLPRTHRDAFLFLPSQKGEWLGTWRASTDLPSALGEIASGVLDGKLITLSETHPNTYAFDLLLGGWVGNLAQRPFPGGQHSAEVVAGKLYLFGGTGSAAGKVQIYDPQANSWSLGTDMPWSARAACSAVIEGRVHLAGGLVGSQTVGLHASYEPATDQWTPLPPLRSGLEVGFAAGGSDGERFFVFGGRAGDGSPAHGFDFVQRYDPTLSSWATSEDVGSSLAPMPSGRSSTGRALWYRDEFHVFGGETSDADNDPEATADKVYPQVQVWSPATGLWRREADMPTARHGISPTLFLGRVFLAGGGVENGSSRSNALEVFSRQ